MRLRQLTNGRRRTPNEEQCHRLCHHHPRHRHRQYMPSRPHYNLNIKLIITAADKWGSQTQDRGTESIDSCLAST